MKLYQAKYLLGKELKWPHRICDSFEFELSEYDDWEKINDNTYARHDGWLNDYVTDEIDASNDLCYVVNIKYFEHSLTEKELKELKERMQFQCIKALEVKRDKLYKDLTTQIDFIKNVMNQ